MTRPASWNLNGLAMLDYLNGDLDARLLVRGPGEASRAIEAGTFFSLLSEFDALEETAIRLCRGEVLDLGAGAGRFALELRKLGVDVRAVDSSPEAVEVMHRRGLEAVECADLFTIATGRFDTILLMMNGIGIVGDRGGLGRFLTRAHEVIRPGGQILLDSLDPRVYDVVSLGASGESVEFRFEYKGIRGEPFRWLFLGPDPLAREALRAGWVSRVVYEDGEGAYLARLHEA